MLLTKFRFAQLWLLPPILVGSLLAATRVSAQDDTSEVSEQLWANFIVGRPVSEKLYTEFDIEYAQTVGDQDPWRYLYGTFLSEYYPNPWLDLTGELVGGYTRQREAENSLEATIRLAVRLHLISQIFSSPFFAKVRPERMSGKRLSIANLARFEGRNFWYDSDRPDESDWRFRNRVELRFAANKPTLATDGVIYLMGDVEFFVPLSDTEAAERFATKSRVRFGPGYRFSYAHRIEVLGMWDRARDTLDEEADIDAIMIDIRFKWFL